MSLPQVTPGGLKVVFEAWPDAAYELDDDFCLPIHYLCLSKHCEDQASAIGALLDLNPKQALEADKYGHRPLDQLARNSAAAPEVYGRVFFFLVCPFLCR